MLNKKNKTQKIILYRLIQSIAFEKVEKHPEVGKGAALPFAGSDATALMS